MALGCLCLFVFLGGVAQAAPPVISGLTVSEVGIESAKLEALINPQGKAALYHFEYGTADCASDPCTSVPSPEGQLAKGSAPVAVSVPLSGLSPATVYHYRLVAKNGEVSTGTDHVFATRAPGTFTGLPDGRAYEQVSPVNKDGGDAEGEGQLSKASVNGEGFSFGSTFGIPGGVGAQELPLYLGSRNGSSGWSTQGLFPPATLGQNAHVMGWTPDFSETFAAVTRLGKPREEAVFALSTRGAKPLMVIPYTPKGESFYAGEGSDTAVFESQAKLPEGEAKTPGPASIAGAPNVYAWDRQSGELRLASVLNDGSSPPQGAFAGPYDFSRGTTANSLREGGPERLYYTQAEHAVSEAGDVYFTARASGQLYLRVNPTQGQSPRNGEGKCTNPSLACTIHVSASQKTNGKSPDGTDPAGPQPTAFQAASADGSRAFFTSPEKLTDDANTGPEQPLAAIDQATLEDKEVKSPFIPKHAVGVALDSKYVYWASPAEGTIGRAEIANPASANSAFIDTGSIECEFPLKSGEFKDVHSEPRWVAVDAGHVYWSNTGCRDKNEVPLDEGGTIGRADIDGGKVEPEFIKGASNPQGVAVNSEHIYWANQGRFNFTETIGRATFEGEGVKEVEQGFFEPKENKVPSGIALTPTDIYFTAMQGDAEAESAYVMRVPLEGGEKEFFFVPSKLRGIAVQGTNLYWASQGEEAIGRIPIADFPKLGSCESTPNCENAFAKVEGALNGLAADPQHLYWSVNGEAPTNPGNDLYLYEPNLADPGEAGTLSDISADSTDLNGAEVKGVLGASADGSRVYFVANAVLGEGATAGTCKGDSVATLTGSCNLYLWEEGHVSFVAQLQPGGGEGITDALNWVGTPERLFGAGSYRPKTSFLTEDGSTLLFRSREKLSAYNNEGAPELYRYRVGDAAGIRCVSCPPVGEAGPAAALGSVKFPGGGPLIINTASVASRNLSADGNRAFFETAAALSPEDTNGEVSCEPVGSLVQQYPACTDVYEWEAPGTGSCQESSPTYSPLNAGCIYLISTGKSKFPSLFGDASASGNDVFFFTRQGLVGQDKDELQDAYDARVGGGLAAQNPTTPVPCESPEACHGPAQTPPAEGTAGSATFVGPANPVPKHKKQKKKKHKKHSKKKQQKHKKGRQGR